MHFTLNKSVSFSLLLLLLFFYYIPHGIMASAQHGSRARRSMKQGRGIWCVGTETLISVEINVSYHLSLLFYFKDMVS